MHLALRLFYQIKQDSIEIQPRMVEPCISSSQRVLLLIHHPEHLQHITMPLNMEVRYTTETLLHALSAALSTLVNSCIPLTVSLDLTQKICISIPSVVWLKDANVPYMQSKHLALTVVTVVVLAFFFLPFTLLLLLGYKLYHFSGRRYIHLILRNLKPILDS